MFLGTFDVTVEKNGLFSVLPGMEGQYNVGDSYRVLATAEEDSNDHVLVYRFNDICEEAETMIAQYVVSADKKLLIPKDYIPHFLGECVVVGMRDAIEVWTKDFYDKISMSDPEIEAMLEQLDETGFLL